MRHYGLSYSILSRRQRAWWIIVSWSGFTGPIFACRRKKHARRSKTHTISSRLHVVILPLLAIFSPAAKVRNTTHHGHSYRTSPLTPFVHQRSQHSRQAGKRVCLPSCCSRLGPCRSNKRSPLRRNTLYAASCGVVCPPVRVPTRYIGDNVIIFPDA